MRTPEGIIEALRQNHHRFKENIEAVREAWEWSGEKKAEELSATYRDAKSTYDRLTSEYREAIRHQLEERRRAVFSAPRVSSDPAMNTLLFRDALRSVKEAEDARDLNDTLELAAQTGDKSLAKAALYRGYSMGASGVVQGYFRQHPDELPKWDSFMDAAEASNKLEKFGLDLSTGIPGPEKPQEAAYANQLAGYPPN